jgi:signal transduction histidine kinase
MQNKITEGYHKIRPAGRHIITIGRDLIKDKYAAIVELVKNAYDADSKLCKVSLLPFKRTVIKGEMEEVELGIRIIIKDEGHGMSYNTVLNSWMVPSTNDKLIRKASPKGRLMQGRKGVGRYAASMLGDDLLLQTVDQKGELTTLYLIWKDFEDAKYLDDVNVLIETFESDRDSGTEIIILGDEKHLSEWNIKQIQNLKFELKKLIPPYSQDNIVLNETNHFKMILEIGHFDNPVEIPNFGYKNLIEEIEPYPLFELYDYRISGVVSRHGIAKLKFHNNRANESPEHLNDFKITLNLNPNRKNDESYCGETKIDFRVFDRDAVSIDGLIGRGLKDPNTGHYVGRREARYILDSFNGIGVYRNGFRLRPLGDAGYDWLELDKDRVQNPSVKIGSDQVIGFIHIEAEEDSGLEEKSARDGLKESSEYFGLQEICKQVLLKLEQRRFIYRRHIGIGRSSRNLENKIKTLYNFSDLKDQVNEILKNIGVEEINIEKINKIIVEKEVSSSKVAEELKGAIAQYQGHATIGKIINVILHEGRKPLGYFKNQIPLISEWKNELQVEFKSDLLEKIISRLDVINEQSSIFVNLFSKLDPLSAKKRDVKKLFNVRHVIENVKDVFLSELNEADIDFDINCDKSQTCYGWKEDLYIVLTNLVDNSIYWLKGVGTKTKKISVSVSDESDFLTIDYRDNGPGIEKTLIESEIIFEPEFSGKSGGGTGLGLAIAGEAIARNDGELKAIFSEEGAFFKIEIKKQ